MKYRWQCPQWAGEHMRILVVEDAQSSLLRTFALVGTLATAFDRMLDRLERAFAPISAF